MGKMEDLILLQQSDLLVKKAKELSLLCDINIGLILFSPNGGLSEFANGDSVEDIYLQFLHQTSEIREGKFDNEESMIQDLVHLKKERELMKKITKIQEIWEEAVKVNLNHQAMRERLSFYNSNMNDLQSLDDIYECEHFIAEAIEKIHEMKGKKLTEQPVLPENDEEKSMVNKLNVTSQDPNSPTTSKRRLIIKDNDQVEPREAENFDSSPFNIQAKENIKEHKIDEEGAGHI